jgi:hypothetical protein
VWWEYTDFILRAAIFDGKKILASNLQDCGTGSELDPDSIGSVDPEFGSGSMRTKMTHKSRKKLRISSFEVLDVIF